MKPAKLTKPWRTATLMETPAVDRVTTVTVGTQQLRVAIRPGTGDGCSAPPLLACNGIGTPLEALAPFTSALDPVIEVVRFDVPGVGGSPATRLPYSLPWLARLAGRMLGRLGYDRRDVLGISWGGALAQQIALQNPQRCRRVVLAATATGALMIPASPRVLRHLSTPRRHPREVGVEHGAVLAQDFQSGFPEPRRCPATGTRAGPPRAA
jgi:pimeloyl-ACP methyl ester carboxylesterase